MPGSRRATSSCCAVDGPRPRCCCSRLTSAPFPNSGHKTPMELITGHKQHRFVRHGRKYKTAVPCNGTLRTLILRTTHADPSPSVRGVPTALQAERRLKRCCKRHSDPRAPPPPPSMPQALRWADAFFIFLDAAKRDSLAGTWLVHALPRRPRNARLTGRPSPQQTCGRSTASLSCITASQDSRACSSTPRASMAKRWAAAGALRNAPAPLDGGPPNLASPP